MNVIDEHYGGKPAALFDKRLLGNASDLLYYAENVSKVIIWIVKF